MELPFYDSVLSFFGLAREEELLAANQKISQLSEILQRLKISSANLDSQLKEARLALSRVEDKYEQQVGRGKLMRKQLDWCSMRLVEFPIETPVNFQKNTLINLESFLGGGARFSDLGDPSKFSSPAQWLLYWCLAHASNAAVEATSGAKNEDGVSRAFLDELSQQAKTASSFLDGAGGLQIAYNAIFEQCEPAMKEAAVGADILLIVAGNPLISDGLARVFWIQAKRSDSGFNLRFDQENKNGLQVEALSRVHDPIRGAFGLYVQYAKELPYVPSVPVSKLSWTDGKYSADLSAIGVRLPEFLVMCTGKCRNVGSFADIGALKAYLEEVSEMKPLYIVTAMADGPEYSQKLSKNHLLSTISDYYREKLGIAKSHQREKGRERERGFDLGM